MEKPEVGKLNVNLMVVLDTKSGDLCLMNPFGIINISVSCNIIDPDILRSFSLDGRGGPAD